MSDNSTTLAFAGTNAISAGAASEGAADNDAAHVCTRSYVLTVDGSTLGAATEEILIAVAQTAITVKKLRVVSSINVATNANKPEFDLAYGDLAAGSLTAVGEFIDLTATALTARTAVDVTVDVDVAAGQGLYLDVDTNGTPADISEDARLTFVVEYELTN